MQFLLVRHKVADYAHWRKVFDAGSTEMARSGLKLLNILRDVQDPNVVVVFLEVTDLKKAKAFTGSKESAKSAEAANLIGKIDGWWLEEL